MSIPHPFRCYTGSQVPGPDKVGCNKCLTTRRSDHPGWSICGFRSGQKVSGSHLIACSTVMNQVVVYTLWKSRSVSQTEVSAQLGFLMVEAYYQMLMVQHHLKVGYMGNFPQHCDSAPGGFLGTMACSLAKLHHQIG